MKIKKPVSAPETQRKIKRSYLTVATVAAAAIVMALPVYADDPLATINALSDFVPKDARIVTIEDAAEADRIFDMLMGSSVPPRKRFIQKYARNVRNLDV